VQPYSFVPEMQSTLKNNATLTHLAARQALPDEAETDFRACMCLCQGRMLDAPTVTPGA